MKKIFLLFSGYNDRAIVSFCRFCEKYAINFKIVAANNQDKILKTIYSKDVLLVRNSKELDLELFESIRTELQVKFNIGYDTSVCIAPSAEYLIKFILINRNQVEQKGFEIPLVSLDVYERFSNKYAFNELCLNANIAVPNEYLHLKNVQFPIVLKPKSYTLEKQFKPIIVNNEQELPDHIDVEEFYIQEYVNGNSYYLLMHVNKDSKTTIYSQENLIQQDKGLSIVLSKSSDIHINYDFSNFIDILSNHNFRGLIMIELKKCGDVFYMIEANPRLWGPLQLTIDANMDLLEAFVMDNGFAIKPAEVDYVAGCYYYWSGGVIQDLMNKKELKFYGINKGEFFDHLNLIQPKDIYLKSDTIQLYLENQ